jgi:hypothetical protein
MAPPLGEARGGKSYFYLTDGAGAVVGVTDSAGSLVAQYHYDPQGFITSSSGTFDATYRLLFGTYNPQSDLYYLNCPSDNCSSQSYYYDPETSQWFRSVGYDWDMALRAEIAAAWADPPIWRCEVRAAGRISRGIRVAYLPGRATVQCSTFMTRIQIFIKAQHCQPYPIFGNWGRTLDETGPQWASVMSMLWMPIPKFSALIPSSKGASFIGGPIGNGSGRW